MESKRGRKPKAVVSVASDDVAPAQKRGRKPKAVYNNNNNNMDSLLCSSDDEHIIMRLNIQNQDEGGCVAASLDAYNQHFLNYSEIAEEPIEHMCGEESKVIVQHVQKHLKVVELLKDFEEKNKNNEWPQTTNICCYWCCNQFSNPPFGIPLKYSNEKFDVFGCFCSLECAAAFNYESRESHDEKCERFNLLNLLAKKIGHDGPIKVAPSKFSLTMFGGHLTIEAFRRFCTTGKIININFPPMMTLTQQIEEINECDISEKIYIPVDNDRINKYALSLKRSKPVNSDKNTLDQTMNLKFGL